MKNLKTKTIDELTSEEAKIVLDEFHHQNKENNLLYESINTNDNTSLEKSYLGKIMKNTVESSASVKEFSQKMSKFVNEQFGS